MEIHISLAPEKLAQIGPVAITNSMVMMFIVMVLLILVFGLIARSAKPVPGRAQGAFELIAEFLLNLVEGTGGKELGRKVFPLVAAIFIFLAFANYTGILPGVGTIYLEEPAAAETIDEGDEAATNETGALEVASIDSLAPAAAASAAVIEGNVPKRVYLMRPPNADLNMTLAMSVLTFTMVQIYGIRAHGAIGRIKHMANPPFLLPIEIISEFSRIISLSARLFGNVFAGEVLLGVIYAMVKGIAGLLTSVTVVAGIAGAVVLGVLPVIFILLELMFGTIQALVFALLTLIYIALAAAHEHGHGEEAHKEEAHHPAAGSAPGHAPAGAGD